MKIRPLFRILAILVLVSAAIPWQMVPKVFAAPTVRPEAPELLQFTAGGHVLGFAADGVYATTGSHALHVEFVGANPVQPQSDTTAQEQERAAALGRVTYAGLWEGIDLAFDAEAGGIYATTYTIEPGADPDDIRLRYNAPLAFTEDGTLSIAFETGTMTESAPVAWQEIHAEKIPVEAAFEVDGQEAGFSFGAYDPNFTLFIDPSLTWNTFLGGGGDDSGYAVTVDGNGNVYVAGCSSASWGSPVRAYTAGYDAFVAKLDSAGNLTWNTFLGGGGNDYGTGIAVYGSGNIYLSGYGGGTWGSPLRAYTSGSDAFAVKLTSSGSLTWNAFLGGSGEDYGNAAAIDAGGNMFVAGYSSASWGSPVRAYTAGSDAFAVKLDSAGTLLWNTFLGGSSLDVAQAAAVDGDGSLYVAGSSSASWGTPVRAYAAGSDAFAAKLTSAGSLTWNTFLGGGGGDNGNGIAVDGSGNVYVAGESSATWGSPVRAHTNDWDAFAAKLASTGSLTWNTFLGGTGEDAGTGIDVDSSESVYVSGHSTATWGSPEQLFAAGYDAFAVRLISTGSVRWSTFLGGSGMDFGNAVVDDGNEIIFLAGKSDASWGSPMRAFSNDGFDAFAVRLNVNPPGPFSKTAPANMGYATTSPTLSWGVSEQATQYAYCIDTVDNDTCDGSWDYIGPLTSVALSGLTPYQTYYWQVIAVNLLGNSHSNGFTWWSFTALPVSFGDVPSTYWAWSSIERLFHAGITGGCGGGNYCPADSATRAEMAIFLERGIHGSGYTPPAATGTVFSDVPVSHWAAAWIEQLSADGITGGCGGGNYCPNNPVTRAEMAIFLLRSEHGSSYTPPAATGMVFGDVPISHWAAAWIEQLYAEGITGGCGGGNYCPNQPTTRAEMAVFLVRTFSLP